jgi:hypothetical protein
VLNSGSSLIGDVAKGADNLDRREHSVLAALHITEVQANAEIWWRFGGGSDRNRALLGQSCNSMRVMQSVQSRINAGDSVYC